MATTSRFGAVVDALVTAIDATSVQHVFDGPPLTSESLTEYVIVGGTNDADDDAGEFAQTWAGLGAKAKDETGEVTCAVLVQTGDDGVKAARDRALVIFGEIETAVRADPTLAVLVSGWLNLSAGRVSQRRNANGLYARLVLTVSYKCRI